MPELFQPSAPQPLGREEPLTRVHIDRYPLTAATTPAKPVPIVLGIDWHSAFDRPVLKGGRWWLPDISKGEPFGTIRGGHAICIRPDSMTDLIGWWEFYDQGSEGACVGFASSRMKTLLERARFHARWLYHEAQKIDFWPGGAYPGATPFYEGTAVSAAMDVLRTVGHKTPAGATPNPSFGIAANRWATSLDDMRAALQSPLHDRLQAFPLLNSWGKGGYPHIVWMPYPTADELLFQRGGEGTIPTDR